MCLKRLSSNKEMLRLSVIDQYCFGTSQCPGIYSALYTEALHRHTHTCKVKGHATEMSRGYRPEALFPEVAHLVHCLASHSSPCQHVQNFSSCCPRATSCFHWPGLLSSCLHLASLQAAASPPPSLDPAGLLAANDPSPTASPFQPERKKRS